MDDKSRMSGDVHVRICEGLGVKFPRATRLVIYPSIKPFEKDQDKMKRRKVIQMKKGTDILNKYGHRNYGIGAFIDTLLEQEEAE